MFKNREKKLDRQFFFSRNEKIFGFLTKIFSIRTPDRTPGSGIRKIVDFSESGTPPGGSPRGGRKSRKSRKIAIFRVFKGFPGVPGGVEIPGLPAFWRVSPKPPFSKLIS